MSQQQVSTGAIQQLFEGQQQAATLQPALQVLDVKKLESSSSARYNLVLSDGVHFVTGMMVTQLNELLESEQVKKLSLVQLTKFSVSSTGRRCLVVSGIEVIQTDCSDKVGFPTNINGASKRAAAAASTNESKQAASSSSSTTASASTQPVMLEEQDVIAIHELEPYREQWTIKARVTNKSEMKRWQLPSSGAGAMFSIALLDQDGGEIGASLFMEAAEKLYDTIQANKVYYIRGGQVKPASKFAAVPSPYELSLTVDSIVQEAPDDASIPAVRYNLVSLSRVEQQCQQPNETVDVMGIAHQVGEVVSIERPQMLATNNTSAASSTIQHRTVVLVDQDQRSVQLVLWGSSAQPPLEVEQSAHPVVAVKAAKVTFPQQVMMLNAYTSGQVQLNPNSDEARSLASWYSETGHTATFVPLQRTPLGTQ